MLSSVLGKTLRDQRRALVGWSLAIAALIAYVVGFWPSLEGSDLLTGFTEDLPEALQAFLGEADLGTARGYLSAQLFGTLLPTLVIVLAVGKGARIIAGEEEDGLLELLLVQPLPRWRIALEKAAGVLATVAVVVAGAYVVALVGVLVVGMEVTAAELAGGMAGLALLGWLLAAVAFAAGAGTGRRVLAIAGGAAVGVAAYIAATFAGLSAGLGWLESASPWTWAFGGDALAEGPSAAGVVALLAGTAALLAVGAWRFSRRDIAG